MLSEARRTLVVDARGVNGTPFPILSVQVVAHVPILPEKANLEDLAFQKLVLGSRELIPERVADFDPLRQPM